MPPAGSVTSRGWSIRRKAAAGFFLAFLALAPIVIPGTVLAGTKLPSVRCS